MPMIKVNGRINKVNGNKDVRLNAVSIKMSTKPKG